MAWNGSDGVKAPKVEEKKRPAIGKGLLAGILVVLAAVAWFVCSTRSTAPSTKADKAVASEPIAEAIPEVMEGGFSVLAPNNKKKVEGKALDKSVDAVESSRAKSEEGLAPARTPAPKRHRKAMFKNGTDQLIYLAVFASDGHSIPPLPRIDKADTDRFINSLRKPIEIEDDDTEQVKEMKKNVMEIRNTIAEIIEQNPDMELSDILNAHRDEFNNALNLHAEARRGYDKLVEEGDMEAAEIYREKANEILDECGAVPIEANEEE